MANRSSLKLSSSAPGTCHRDVGSMGVTVHFTFCGSKAYRMLFSRGTCGGFMSDVVSTLTGCLGSNKLLRAFGTRNVAARRRVRTTLALVNSSISSVVRRVGARTGARIDGGGRRVFRNCALGSNCCDSNVTRFALSRGGVALVCKGSNGRRGRLVCCRLISSSALGLAGVVTSCRRCSYRVVLGHMGWFWDRSFR